MQLYDFTGAPSPRRVRIFIAEKGMTIPAVQVDIRRGEQFSPQFMAVNPRCVVPALALDDGTCIAESSVICRYLEEIRPEPNLLGRDARERALIGMWDRHVENEGFGAVAEALRNADPRFEDRGLPGSRGVPQIPALAERGRKRAARFLDALDARLGESAYVACERFSVADITAMVTVDFAAAIELGIGDRPDLARWHGEVAARPSAGA